MTRICAQCKTYLGEKCPDCGHEQLALKEGPAIYRCLECALEFEPGQGGTSHGLCDACVVRSLGALDPNPVT